MTQENNDRVWNSLERLHDKVDNNTKTLHENTKDLEYHIKRTDLLEESMIHLDNDVQKINETQNSVVSVLAFLMKAIVVMGIIAGTLVHFGII